MKTNKVIFSLTATLLIGSLIFTSCKKKQEVKNEDGQSSTDSRNVQSENDNATSDVNTVVGNNTSLHGRSASTNSTNDINTALGITSTGYTIDTTGAYIGTIKINYDGTVINNRKREGSIRLTIVNYAGGQRWKQAGCVLKVDYIDYKVTRSSDGKSVKLNGTQNITNITGGSWFELILLKTQASLATSVTGTNLNITFEDGKTAVYNINRKFTYTFPNNVLTCTGEGIGSDNSLNNLENYGTTRDGDAFTSQVSTPIVWNWTCGAWAPVQGYVIVQVAGKDFSLKCTFGVNSAGNVVTPVANSCPYGWKIEWNIKADKSSKVIAYI